MQSKAPSAGAVLVIFMTLISCAGAQRQHSTEVKDARQLDELCTVAYTDDYVPFPVIGTGGYAEFVAIFGSDNYLDIIDRLVEQGFIVNDLGIRDHGTYVLDSKHVRAEVRRFSNPESMEQESPRRKQCRGTG